MPPKETPRPDLDHALLGREAICSPSRRTHLPRRTCRTVDRIGHGYRSSLRELSPACTRRWWAGRARWLIITFPRDFHHAHRNLVSRSTPRPVGSLRRVAPGHGFRPTPRQPIQRLVHRQQRNSSGKWRGLIRFRGAVALTLTSTGETAAARSAKDRQSLCIAGNTPPPKRR